MPKPCVGGILPDYKGTLARTKNFTKLDFIINFLRLTVCGEDFLDETWKKMSSSPAMI